VSGTLLWWLNLLVGVGVFTLLAVSLNLINGYAGMFHLGHHGFWAMGAYAAAWLTIVLLPSGRFLAEHDRDHDGLVTRAEFADAARFAALDTDGVLSAAELRALDPTEPLPSALFLQAHDGDHDGWVTAQEYGYSPDFARLDANGDGMLSAQELEPLDQDLPSRRFLAAHDLDGDGQVSRAEYQGPEFDQLDADGALSKGELEQGLDHRADLYLLSLLFAMAVAAVGGLLIGIPCLRLRGDYLAIATLGFGEIVRIAIQNSDPATLGGSLGLHVPRVLMRMGPETKGEFRLLTFGIIVAFCVLATWGIRNFIRSAQGRRLLAVAQDETAAGLLGINPTNSKVLAFVIGAAIAGLAGGLFAHFEGTITPLDFSFMEMVKMFLIIVLGGMGSLSGCVVGAFLVIGTERLLASSHGVIAEWWQVEYPLLLAIMIIFCPRGIFGRREITDYYRMVRQWWARRAQA